MSPGRLPPLGAAGRLKAAWALRRRIHTYLRQLKLRFDPITSSRGTNSGEDRDFQGAARGLEERRPGSGAG